MPSKSLDEIRTLSVEFRVLQDSPDEFVIEGVAAPFNEWVPINGSYMERFTPETFADSVKLRGKGLPLILSHDRMEMPIGKAIDWDTREDGLWGTWKLDNGREMSSESFRLAKEGYLTGLSVGFTPGGHPPGDTDTWEDINGVDHCTRGPGARLSEVSAVSVGAYPSAVIHKVRTAGMNRRDPRIDAYRKWLEEIGASQ